MPANLLNDYDGEGGFTGYAFPLYQEVLADGLKLIPKYIYIAGPMRGYEAYNFPAFYKAEHKLIALGWAVGNPARMDDESGKPPEDTTPREAMQRDTTWITNNADAMYMLKGWEKSTGARTEWALACMLQIPIYYEESL